MTLRIRLSTLILLLILACLGAWTVSRSLPRPNSLPSQPIMQSAETIVANQPSVASNNNDDESKTIQIYKKVSPGVVNITSTTLSFDFFFNAVPEQGSGSGSIIDDQGHILTNYHVIESARLLEVTLPTAKQKFKAQVVGTDQSNDLAIIKINPPRSSLNIVELGTSFNLNVGQKVLAIGNPFGLEGTLTVGIISSLRRSIQARNGSLIEDVIQTDAAINPGNSGGPLLDFSGKLIGINTQIFSTSGGSIGIGFAVPVDTAKRIIPDLISKGKVERPHARLKGYELTSKLAQLLNLPVKQGILVARTSPGDSFSEAGIRGGKKTYVVGNVLMILGGDIIVEADNQLVDSIARLNQIIDKRRPGDTISIKIFRSQKPITLRVPLLEKPGLF